MGKLVGSTDEREEDALARAWEEDEPARGLVVIGDLGLDPRDCGVQGLGNETVWRPPHLGFWDLGGLRQRHGTSSSSVGASGGNVGCG